MGNILIITEIQKGAIREASYELASFAQKVAAASGREVKSVVIGSGVGEQLKEAGVSPRELHHIGVPDRFLEHASRKAVLELAGLSPERIAARIREYSS